MRHNGGNKSANYISLCDTFLSIIETVSSRLFYTYLIFIPALFN